MARLAMTAALGVSARDRVSAKVMTIVTTAIVAPAARTGTPGTTAAKRMMVVGVGVTGIVDGTAPMTEAAVAKIGGTTTATHAMSAVTALGVASIMAIIRMNMFVSAMSPRTPDGAGAVASGDKVRRETASSSTSRLPKAGRRASSAP